MALILIISLAACGPSTTSETSSEEPADSAQTSEQTDASDGASGNVLVVFFSRTGEQYQVGEIDKGNTAIVAEMIAEETGADTFEVLPQEDYYPYTYDELTEVAKQEQSENARPAYQENCPDLSAYDTVFIGAPVWWGDWPMIMYTFFEENEEALEGKVLAPFCTHAGSGLSGFDNKLHAALPGSTVDQGLAITGSEAQNDPDSARGKVNDWLNSLGY